MYDVSSEKVQYSGPDVLAVILLGIVGGIFGSLYNYLVDKVLRTYSIINEYVTVPSYLITTDCFFF
jgi:chloride channel 7